MLKAKRTARKKENEFRLYRYGARMIFWEMAGILFLLAIPVYSYFNLNDVERGIIMLVIMAAALLLVVKVFAKSLLFRRVFTIILSSAYGFALSAYLIDGYYSTHSGKNLLRQTLNDFFSVNDGSDISFTTCLLSILSFVVFTGIHWYLFCRNEKSDND